MSGGADEHVAVVAEYRYPTSLAHRAAVPSPRRRTGPLRPLACGLSAAFLVAGCGGGDDHASEQRIQRERDEAAVIAKQEERIKQLERPPRAPRGESAPGQSSAPPVQRAPSRRGSSSRSEGSSRQSDDWPGGSGYTAILASRGSEAEARRIQKAASGRGLDAGVLYSTNYRSLRPGYWVVFSGTSSSKQDADRRAARGKSLGYRDAYPRFVSG